MLAHINSMFVVLVLLACALPSAPALAEASVLVLRRYGALKSYLSELFILVKPACPAVH